MKNDFVIKMRISYSFKPQKKIIVERFLLLYLSKFFQPQLLSIKWYVLRAVIIEMRNRHLYSYFYIKLDNSNYPFIEVIFAIRLLVLTIFQS